MPDSREELAYKTKKGLEAALRLRNKTGDSADASDKAVPLGDYARSKTSGESPAPKPSPTDSGDTGEPQRDKYDPGLGGTASYVAAVKKWKATQEAKKSGQEKAMRATPK